eukprot:1186662-Pyramimonas_sp.AAC.1
MARETAATLADLRGYVERTIRTEVHESTTRSACVPVTVVTACLCDCSDCVPVHEHNSKREKDFAAVEAEVRKTYARSSQEQTERHKGAMDAMHSALSRAKQVSSHPPWPSAKS